MDTIFKKYKVFKVTTDLEEDYYVFSNDINQINEKLYEKYENQNPEKINLIYVGSTDDIYEAKKVGKQIVSL